MRGNRIRLLAGALLTAAVVVSVGFLTVNSVRATSVDEPSAVIAELQAVGVDAIHVNFTPSEQRVEIVVREGYGDAWAITVIPRVMSYLKQSGSVSVSLLDITIIDNLGSPTYQSFDDPVEVSARSTPGSLDNRPLKDCVPQLQVVAEKGGVVMTDLEAWSSPFGVVVNQRVTISETAGSEQTNQVRYVVFDLLPKLRECSEKVAGLHVTLYRVAMVTQSGEAIVDYVVDPATRTVNAWAPTIGPVWASDHQPPVLKKAPSFSSDQQRRQFGAPGAASHQGRRATTTTSSHAPPNLLPLNCVPFPTVQILGGREWTKFSSVAARPETISPSVYSSSSTRISSTRPPTS